MSISLDIGGTWTRVSSGVRLRTEPSYDNQLARLAEAVPRATAPVGVSFGGRVTAAGTVRVALNLRDYEGRPLGADLSALLGVAVRVAHDATCGLVGEALAGALQGFERCGYLTLSTGVGAALRLGGVWLTTEVGHQLVAGNPLPCDCGQTGCLQTLTGGGALRRRLGRPLESVDDQAFWAAYAESLALGVANFALAAGLEAVAVGGAVALGRPALWPLLQAALARVLTYQRVVVLPARLGEHAPLAGAARLWTLPADAVLH
ncbi:ROK family protein [Dactylosporangium vinaceum]|uniref:ROK family protein n=1 Tax=Dactylosporangium vinaceum TaxID=53362 RepID=A0ABV5M856_9ACTN|nr:ROK family protein [Dactylosporangium vinaceum]UAB94316.1 ROK family protein [Dactylosporangium vinaceum]